MEFKEQLANKVGNIKDYDEAMELINDLILSITFVGTMICPDAESYREYRQSVADYILEKQFDENFQLTSETAH